MENDCFEIEYKWDAKNIDWDEFVTFAKTLNPTESFRVKGPDFYYRKGEHVVRHRNGKRANELTIKKRTNMKNTTVRAEIEINLDKTTTKEEVELFFNILDYKLEITLVKDCQVFYYTTPSGVMSLVVYDVECDGESTARFVEIEPDKKLDTKTSKAMLKEWAELLYKNTKLTDKERLHESLYEIYTGKTYAKLKT